jgi:Protein of unknown function (DUF2878)
VRKLINFVLFQLGWFACILGAAHGYVSWAVLFCLAVVAFHLWQSSEPMQEGVLLLKILVLGIAADTLLLQTGSLIFESKGLLPALSPIWMWSLWVILGCTLNESMSWLKGRFVLAAVLGAITGPLSYLAGVKLGAAQWGNEMQAIVLLGIIWAIAMPLLFWWAGKVPTNRPLLSAQ